MPRSFNGTSDFISANAAASFGSNVAYSVSLWVKGPSNSGSDKVAFSEGSTAGIRPFMELYNGVGALGLRINNSSGQVLSIAATATVFDNTWHHICHTQSGAGDYALYVDGSVDHSGTYSTPSPGTYNSMTIGALGRSSIGSFFPGSVAEVAKWSRQLGAKEVSSLAIGLPASHLGPDHYWPLWGADSPEPDIGTGAHATGSLTGTSPANGARIGRRLLTLA